MIQIDKEHIDSFAYCNAGLLPHPPKAVVLEFHGLGGGAMEEKPSEIARLYAENDILYLAPYDNPWSWMNDVAVRTADLILDAVFERFGLSADVPVISTGGSMGGLGALIFTRYSRYPVKACAANCPVCDLVLHDTERPDLPRTIFSAFAHYTGGLEAAVMTASPVHQADNFPRIPYYIVHGGADKAVNKQMHSDRFVARMRENGQDIEYCEVPGMEHCDLRGGAKAAYYGFILHQVKRLYGSLEA